MLKFIILLEQFFDNSKIEILSFFDRNFNRLFNRKNCIKLYSNARWIKYNHVFSLHAGEDFRYLGKNWYVLLKNPG